MYIERLNQYYLSLHLLYLLCFAASLLFVHLNKKSFSFLFQYFFV